MAMAMTVAKRWSWPWTYPVATHLALASDMASSLYASLPLYDPYWKLKLPRERFQTDPGMTPKWCQNMLGMFRNDPETIPK